jgi:FMN phosphatase YigB (HAD superfamily)
MKYIFDFDDVLFDNTKKFKEKMFSHLEQAGIPRTVAVEEYKLVRSNEFSLKNFINTLFNKYGIDAAPDMVYEDIMRICQVCVNQEVLKLVRAIGPENCFIVSYGDKEFQEDKIRRSAISSLFAEIQPVEKRTKKEQVEAICRRFKNEDVVFIDDKQHFFEDLDLEKYPRLRTILFNEEGLDELRREVERGRVGDELRSFKKK